VGEAAVTSPTQRGAVRVFTAEDRLLQIRNILELNRSDSAIVDAISNIINSWQGEGGSDV
jgi:hypothetical protein